MVDISSSSKGTSDGRPAMRSRNWAIEVGRKVLKGRVVLADSVTLAVLLVGVAFAEVSSSFLFLTGPEADVELPLSASGDMFSMSSLDCSDGLAAEFLAAVLIDFSDEADALASLEEADAVAAAGLIK